MRKYEGIKKIELNCHLDGSLDVSLVSKWSKLPKEEIINKLTRTTGIKNLSDYLEKFQMPLEYLQVKTHLKDAALYLGSSMKEENVVYAEVRIAPLLHTKKGLSLEEIIDSVLLGFKLSELKVNLILVMKREMSFEENKTVIKLAKKYLNKGVVAVDLCGDEGLFPTSTFKELFDFANEKGVPFVITAGENGSFKDIDDAIKFGARRIGHGVKAIKSFNTMESLKQKHIPLEICLSSNLDTRLFTKYVDHPISRLIDSGVCVTINTDNRTLSKTDLSHEYYLLDKYFGFTKEDFIKFNKNSLEHSFLNDKDKDKIKALLD